MQNSSSRFSKQEKMFGLVREYLQSGCRQTDIYLREGITKDSFRYWLKKYKKHLGNLPDTNDFISVEIESESSPESKTKKLPELTLKYPNSVCLTVGSGIDTEQLRSLITIL